MGGGNEAIGIDGSHVLHLHGGHGGHGAEVGTVSRHQGCLLLHQLEGGEERTVGPGPAAPTPMPSLAPLPATDRGTRRVGAGPGGQDAAGRGPAQAPGVSAHGLGVGAVGSKLQGDGAEHAQLGSHLLHAAETSLLLRVGKLHHQAG